MTRKSNEIKSKMKISYAHAEIRTQVVVKYSISNDLDGTEDDVLWAKQYDKSDTDSEEKLTRYMLT